MPYHTQAERRYPYFVEVEGLVIPTLEEFERGKRFADGLARLREGLEGIEDLYLTVQGSSLNRGRVIILPSFPILRKIIRADGFYEYTSPNEETKSKTQLVVSSFELLRSPHGNEQLESTMIKARSPQYTSTYGDPITLAEVFTLDPTEHQVAVHKR